MANVDELLDTLSLENTDDYDRQGRSEVTVDEFKKIEMVEEVFLSTVYSNTADDC